MSGIRSALWRAATPMAKWSLTDCSVNTSSDTPRDRAAPRHIVTQPVSCHHASTAILPAARPVRVGSRHAVGAGILCEPARCGSRHAGDSHQLWEPACRRQPPLTPPTASGARQAPVAAMAAPTPRKGCRCQSSNLWEPTYCGRPARCGSRHAGDSHQLWEPACRRQAPLTPPTASGARQTPVAAMAAPTAPPTATLNQSPASSTCSAARGR